MFDWNDLRYFLAVASGGSTLAASRTLRVSQTTVARRIAALEQALGFPLFEKRQAGYALTPAGEELLARAGQVESARQRLLPNPTSAAWAGRVNRHPVKNHQPEGNFIPLDPLLGARLLGRAASPEDFLPGKIL